MCFSLSDNIYSMRASGLSRVPVGQVLPVARSGSRRYNQTVPYVMVSQIRYLKRGLALARTTILTSVALVKG